VIYLKNKYEKRISSLKLILYTRWSLWLTIYLLTVYILSLSLLFSDWIMWLFFYFFCLLPLRYLRAFLATNTIMNILKSTDCCFNELPLLKSPDSYCMCVCMRGGECWSRSIENHAVSSGNLFTICYIVWYCTVFVSLPHTHNRYLDYVYFITSSS
jgi:hypothetical protein